VAEAEEDSAIEAEEAAEAEEAEEAEEAGKAQPGTTKDIVLYLSGENDDYVSDLMETLTSKINHYLQQHRRGPHSLSTAYSMKPKQINLLYHIESGERFEKFLRRDFSAVADNILGSLPEEPPPLPPLPVPQKTKAKKARVEASNQGTSGTSELATTSSAALSTASAVPLDTSDTPALGSAPQVALVGRGRGRDNRPAWITEHNGSVPGAAPANVVVVAAAVVKCCGLNNTFVIPSGTQRDRVIFIVECNARCMLEIIGDEVRAKA
jgi:hypothetical protein